MVAGARQALRRLGADASAGRPLTRRRTLDPRAWPAGAVALGTGHASLVGTLLLRHSRAQLVEPVDVAVPPWPLPRSGSVAIGERARALVHVCV